MPANAYPLARYKYLLQCLAATSPDASIWETNRRSPIIQAAGNIFRDVSEIVNLALLMDGKPPLFKRKKENAPPVSVLFLDLIEAKLVNAVEELDERSLEMIQSIIDSKDSVTSPETKALQALLKFIGSTLKELNVLAEKVNAKLTDKNDAEIKSEIMPKDEYTVSIVKKLSQSAAEKCAEILKEGAAVDVAIAKRGLSEAKKIVLAKRGKEIVGLAIIKPFRSVYAAKISKNSSSSIEVGTAELGYIAISKACRGSGLGQKLVRTLLTDVRDPLFSTTTSVAMKKILSKQGFKKAGQPWNGHAGRLTLWKRSEIAPLPNVKPAAKQDRLDS
ncbi:GNAT family N-acetyltransferase [Granulicella sp. S156]|uniref:GNAT family N-acetyltransferase n=1 Tax=Granulicella sp. S156 TaxID=1747224 RepID=UPI00131B0CC3|nr:GNAT family N-acetyltransferase [Granulicella sp. S156]